MRGSRRLRGAITVALTVALVAAPIAMGVATQSVSAASGDTDPVVKFAYVDTDTGNLTLVTASGTRIDMGVTATVIGAAKDMDADYYVEVPYVQSNGGLFVIDRTGEKKQLASNAKSSSTKLAIGDLDDDGTRAVFYANASEKLVKVTYSGSPQAVGGGLNAQSAVGIADLTGDGVDEIVFTGTSSGYFHYYNGTNVGMGFGPNNPGEVGAPRDFDGDGVPRIPYVDGSNNVDVAYVNGSVTTVVSGNAEKVPVAAVNWTGDSTLEVLFLSTNSANTVKYAPLSGSKGTVLGDAVESVGVAWVQDTDEPLALSNFTMTSESGTLTISFDATEDLQSVTVDIAGPVDTTLTLGDFEQTASGADYTYEGTYTPSEDGEYTATLDSATAVDGDTANPDATDSATVDARFDVSDLQASAASGQDVAITFDASEKLNTVTVTLSGAENATLDLSSFSTSDDSAPYTYTGQYDGSTDGTYEVTFDSGTSLDGQTDGENLTASVTVDQAFTVWDFTLTNASGKLRVSFTAGETLRATNVTVEGPSDRTLHLADFSESAVADGYRYVTTYTPDADGTFNGTLQRAESHDGQVVTPDLTDGVVIDRGFTVWDATLDVTGDGDLRVAFNASDDVTDATVSLSGPEDATLDFAAFSQVSANPYRYVTTYDATVDGTYSVSVSDVTADSGQTFDGTLTESVTRDRVEPRVTDVALAESVNADGFVSESDSVTVTATVTGDVGTVTADLSAFDAGTVTLTHRSGDTYAADVPVTADANAGSQTAVVTAVDGQGNADSAATGSVTVDTTDPSVTLGSDFTTTVETTIEFAPVSASDATTNVVFYMWTFGNGDSERGRSVQYAYERIGTYAVTLRVLDAAGNVATATVNVTVDDYEVSETQTTAQTTERTDTTTTPTTETTTASTVETRTTTTRTATVATTTETTATADTTPTTTGETTAVTASTGQSGNTTTERRTGTTATEAPGFGLATAFVALAGIVLLAVRRRA